MYKPFHYQETSVFKFSNRPVGQIAPPVTPSAFAPDSRYESRFSYAGYDVAGNPGMIVMTNGTTTAYLWGYNNTYPVAKVTGSNYSTVAALVNNATLQSLSTSDAAMRTELNKIRTGLAGTIAQVTTYTYAPLVGITSATDAKGVTTYYEYDNFQRLMNIKDKDGNIVKHMDYHYQGN